MGFKALIGNVEHVEEPTLEEVSVEAMFQSLNR